ncbi:uncharacterized protein CDAR_2441 [Caerostris darwini]|uniref:Uncharacterized protein n=1 Tax=Caerostris darwini TaxID=1538125 RepID=A0AAV4W7X7_9ARAC|nr:uncharacterized protein CDAR_2441 [Caerostris darwini]
MESAWINIPENTFRNLIDSLPACLAAVRSAKGGYLAFDKCHPSINDKSLLKIIFHSVAFIEANCPRIAVIILRKTLSGWTSPELHSKQNPPSCEKNRKKERKYRLLLGEDPITKERYILLAAPKSNEAASGSDERDMVFFMHQVDKN